MHRYIEYEFQSLANQLKTLKSASHQVVEIADMCTNALRNGKKVMWCGNGGSASMSQHLSAELVGRYRLDRPAMNSIALSVDTSNLTAIGNDYGYDVVFSRQLQGIGNAGDVLFGLSTSGNSKNVISAFEMAKQKDIKTVALVGAKGGKMRDMADVAICVPADTSAHIQELHLTVGHLICDLIERNFYGK